MAKARISMYSDSGYAQKVAEEQERQRRRALQFTLQQGAQPAPGAIEAFTQGIHENYPQGVQVGNTGLMVGGPNGMSPSAYAHGQDIVEMADRAIAGPGKQYQNPLLQQPVAQPVPQPPQAMNPLVREYTAQSPHGPHSLKTYSGAGVGPKQVEDLAHDEAGYLGMGSRVTRKPDGGFRVEGMRAGTRGINLDARAQALQNKARRAGITGLTRDDIVQMSDDDLTGLRSQITNSQSEQDAQRKEMRLASMAASSNPRKAAAANRLLAMTQKFSQQNRTPSSLTSGTLNDAVVGLQSMVRNMFPATMTESQENRAYEIYNQLLPGVTADWKAANEARRQKELMNDDSAYATSRFANNATPEQVATEIEFRRRQREQSEALSVPLPDPGQSLTVEQRLEQTDAARKDEASKPVLVDRGYSEETSYGNVAKDIWHGLKGSNQLTNPDLKSLRDYILRRGADPTWMKETDDAGGLAYQLAKVLLDAPADGDLVQLLKDAKAKMLSEDLYTGQPAFEG